MQLYNKIQEFLKTSQELKDKTANALNLAKSEMNAFVEEKNKEQASELKNEIQASITSEFLKLPAQVKEKVKELVNQSEITAQIHAELLSQFNKQEIQDDLKRALRFEIRNELEGLLKTTELKNKIKEAQTGILADTIASSEQSLREKILKILENRLDKITESVVKNLDFSFLKAQPELFYKAIEDNLKEMFLSELKSDYLQKYINGVIDSYFKQEQNLKLLRETELKALCYLQVVLEVNKVKMLQDALMLENQNTQNELKIQNEIAYNEKRKQLIADGKLENETFKTFKFKVI